MEQAPDHVEAFDTEWFERFEKLYFEDYEKLTGGAEIRRQERDSFLSGESTNPNLDYPKLDVTELQSIESDLLDLKYDLLEKESNEAVAKIYRAKLNEHIASTRMLLAAAEGDDRRFATYSEFIHGTPSIENTAYVLSVIQHKLLKDRSSWSPERIAAADEILELVSGYEAFLDEGSVTRDILPEKVVDKDVLGDAQEVAGQIESALEGLEVYDWSVVVDEAAGRQNFSVSQADKLVHVPSATVLSERKISPTKLAGLIAHEVETHIQRRHNGERSKLKLLGFGLDRYLKGEEGVATYNEQQITGAEEFAGILGYFSIAVAKGFDGKPRDFRETFEVMNKYHLAVGAKEQTAKTRAWNNCVRIFRGTTADTPGTVFTKDLAYLGNREVWQLVQDDSEAVQSFSVGKYDPTNNEHIALLSQLGILDKDLEAL